MTSSTADLIWPATSPAEWSGRWIAPAHLAPQGGVYFYARRRFTVRDIATSVPLHIAAETMYLLYINGREVGRGPIRGTHTRNFFDTYDISRDLQSGENWIAVAVHCPQAGSFKHAPARPGVLVQFDDGSVRTDETWQVLVSEAHRLNAPLYAHQIGPMEWKDRRAEPTGWQVGRDLSRWSTPVVLNPDERLGGKALLPRDIPALSVERLRPTAIPLIAATPACETNGEACVARRMNNEAHATQPPAINPAGLLGDASEPITLTPLGDGRGVAMIFDFGRAVNGGIEIDIDAPAGTIVDIGYQEELRSGRLEVAMTEYAFADRYVLSDGRQRVGNEFAERGYRMAQIVFRGFDRPLTVHGVTGINRLYPYKPRGAFSSSDAKLDRLWSMCDQTLRACSTDTFVDCPWRENVLWLNDLVVEALTSLQVFGDPRIVKRCLRLAASQVRDDGLFPGVVPFGKIEGLDEQASMDRMTLTAGNLTVPQVLEDYWLYTGDRAGVEPLVELMEPMLSCFESWEDPTGLCRPPRKFWNFIDWSFPEDIEGRTVCAIEWLRVLALDTTARLLGRLDPGRDTIALTEKSSRIVAAINDRFWSGTRGVYLEGIETTAGRPMMTQLTQALAILSGRLSPQRNRQLGEAIRSDDLLAPELFMHHFVLRALVTTGQAEAARKRIEQYWGPIVASGSPTVWELGVHTFGKAGFGGAGSLCHGFSTTPIDFMQGVVLGVRPTAAGFTRCRFAPKSVGLDHAKGAIPTPHGDLHVAWWRRGDLFDASLTVPPGVAVDLAHGGTLGPGRHRVTLALPHTLPGPAPKDSSLTAATP